MPEDQHPDRLDSWKEIAVHLGRGVRTVQRWEKEEGLPVHRHVHNRQGSVYAFKSAVDDWWARRGGHLSLEASEPAERIADLAGLPDGRRSWPAIAFVGVLLVATAIAVSVRGGWVTSAPSVSHIRSIAVLPFGSLTLDPGDAALEVGLADALIRRLGVSRDVIVRPISAVLPFRHTTDDPVAVGRQLQVDAVLKGRLQHVGDRLRLSAQLFDCSSGRVLWAGDFDERVSAIFAVQDTLAERVGSALLLQFTPADRARTRRLESRDPDAYLAYLQGRWFWNQRTREGFEKSIERLTEAVDRDPRFALAHAALAEAYVLAAAYLVRQPHEAIPLARRAALSALAIDDGLGSAHASLGMIAQIYDWQWRTADREYARAIEVEPGYPTAHHWRGELLGQLGRSDEAIASLQRARALDPLSLIINTDLGRAYYFARRYDEAAAQLGKTLDLDSRFVVARVWLAKVEIERGRYDEAIRVLDQNRGIDDTLQTDWVRAEIEAAAGHSDAARDLLARLVGHPGMAPWTVAITIARLGDRDALLRWIERCFTEHAPIAEIYASPALDPFRNDPAVLALFQRAGLAQ